MALARAKNTSIEPHPHSRNIEIVSRAPTSYNGFKTDPCNLNGIGVASRHRISSLSVAQAGCISPSPRIVTELCYGEYNVSGRKVSVSEIIGFGP